MAQILDGRKTAAVIKDELKAEIATLARPPHLATVQVGEDPASVMYLRGKHRDCSEIGINSTPYELPAMASAEEVFALIDGLNADADIDGIIAQTPFPDHINDDEALARVTPDKDVDGLHPLSWGLLMQGQPRYISATPAGVLELLQRHDITVSGAVVGIAGRGTTVGRPLSVLLSLKGVDATVVLCHSRTRDLAAELRRCDIVVAAMGQPGMITAAYVKEGAVVIDVGQGLHEGKIVGDVDRASVDKVASWVSPTPGGVGPMTRVMLLKNVVKSARARQA